ncbi:MAG: Mrp/NBP35 family ATP-binding protein [Anaerolineae bacterium]|nr:Mrp/NBP35 family ATP-binding protein [Anaerolineae bacterium]MCX8067881.1 Mrp/NBP35 family ATP-binding protein [Anaerolineae bacterium]
MLTIEEIHSALRRVVDPELGRDIVDLGMVQDLRVEGGIVSFTLALTTLACPLRESIVEQARRAILALEGVRDVRISLREMTLEERASIWRRPPEPQRGTTAQFNRIEKVLAVMSGKGGVGKSSLAALLAVGLRRQGQRVGILDADITGPSIPRMFGLQEPPLMGPMGLLPAETTTGIRVMSINLLLPDEDEAVLWRGPLISGAIQQFWSDVLWGDLNVLVVDLPPGTSDAALTVMQSLPVNGILLVTSPQDLAGMVVRKAARMAERLGVPILGLVENMSYVTCPKCGEQIEVFGPSQALHTAAVLGIPILARMPLDPELARLCDLGQVEQYTSHAADALVLAISQRLIPFAEGRRSYGSH